MNNEFDEIKKIFEKIDQITKHEKKSLYYSSYLDFHKKRYKDLLALFDKIKSPAHIRLLDVGSCPYHLAVILKKRGYEVDAINFEFGEYEKIISDNFDINIKKIDLSSELLPYNDSVFDVILFSETMEHLNFNLEKLFNEFNRVLKTNGKLIITTPNLARLNNRVKMLLGKSVNFDITKAFFNNIHFREYTKVEVEYLLKKSNFTFKEIFYKNFDYPNIPIYIKLVDNFIGLLIPSTRSNIIAIAEKKI